MKKPVSQQPKPEPVMDERSDLLAQIRKGKELKKVPHEYDS